LQLDATGVRLAGVDRLGPAKGVVRFSWDVPLSIHFHLHPSTDARVTLSAEAAELVLDSGETWRLTAAGAAVSIEDGLYFADSAGARPARQVVLRAQCYGASEVAWVIERIGLAEAANGGSPAAKGLLERLAETDAGFAGVASR
jgi:uncharacterized heparinase superfamily protein